MDTNIGLAMVNGLGQMALIAIFFGLIKRLDMAQARRSLVLGLVFGAGAVIAMMTPAEVTPGVFLDTRAIMVGLAGAFAGIPAALVASVMAGGFRIWLGGAGMPVGLVAIAIAAAVGMVWHLHWPRDGRGTPLGLGVLGLGIALHSLVALFLPVAMPDGFYLFYFPAIWATCLVATMALGWMMQREIKLILREKSLSALAFTDTLTGIANRRAFDRRVAESDFRMDGPEFGLVLIDIDHFKSVNDRHGHDAGDVVLCSLAALLESEVREHDLVARYGGEEFVVLLPGTDLGASAAIAERIRARIAAWPIDVLDERLFVTASFGVATSRGHQERRAIIAAADLALYKAKEYGRNRVESVVLPPLQAPAPKTARAQAAVAPVPSR